MKSGILFIGCLIITQICAAQFRIMPGTQLVSNGAAVINLNNMDLVNDGSMLPGAGLVKFTGAANSTIGGGSVSMFYELELAKAVTNKILLAKNILVNRSVICNSGLLDLN